MCCRQRQQCDSKMKRQDPLNEGKISTGKNQFNGDPFSGNDRCSRPKPPDNAILFPVSGMNVIEAN